MKRKHNIVHRNPRIYIYVAIFVLFSVWIWFEDAAQQKRMYIVSEAYQQMEKGDYRSALEGLHFYYDNRSAFFWTLSELAAPEERKKTYIEKMITLCEEKIDSLTEKENTK